jgi:hypothetical protein
MKDGSEKHHWTQHIALCGNGCVCHEGPPSQIEAEKLLTCQTAVNMMTQWMGMQPMNAECMLEDGTRPDMICRNPDGVSVSIIEFKSNNKNIMTDRPSVIIKNRRRRHLGQAANYALTWNNSELCHSIGPCTTIFVHYLDADKDPWLTLDPGLWEEYSQYAPIKQKKGKSMNEDPSEAAEEDADAVFMTQEKERQKQERRARGMRRSGGEGKVSKKQQASNLRSVHEISGAGPSKLKTFMNTNLPEGL